MNGAHIFGAILGATVALTIKGFFFGLGLITAGLIVQKLFF